MKKKLQTAFNQTLKTISVYRELGFTVPFTLKGNLGEFMVAEELIKRFPQSKIEFIGGAYPGVDIIIDGIKIQVKTQVKKEPHKFRGGEWDNESSPTVKKRIFEKIDFLILVILYLSEDFTEVINKNFYIFNKDEFKYFNPIFCWSGNKGDCTIVNVLYVKGEPPEKLREKINFYNTDEYKKLFKQSRDNWNKITAG
jgi:hypothetical protein